MPTSNHIMRDHFNSSVTTEIANGQCKAIKINSGSKAPERDHRPNETMEPLTDSNTCS